MDEKNLEDERKAEASQGVFYEQRLDAGMVVRAYNPFDLEITKGGQTLHLRYSEMNRLSEAWGKIRRGYAGLHRERNPEKDYGISVYYIRKFIAWLRNSGNGKQGREG